MIICHFSVVVLQWTKNTNIQGLKEVCRVHRKAHDMNVMCNGKLAEFPVDVGPMAIQNEEPWP